jgi:hypothetical protein
MGSDKYAKTQPDQEAKPRSGWKAEPLKLPVVSDAVLRAAGRRCVQWTVETDGCFLCSRGDDRNPRVVGHLEHDLDCELRSLDAPAKAESVNDRAVATIDQLSEVLETIKQSARRGQLLLYDIENARVRGDFDAAKVAIKKLQIE